MGKPKWQPKLVKVKKSKVTQGRFEQLLAEVGEVLYKRLCQQVLKNAKASTEPAFREFRKTRTKKAAFK